MRERVVETSLVSTQLHDSRDALLNGTFATFNNDALQADLHALGIVYETPDLESIFNDPSTASQAEGALFRSCTF